MTPWLDIVGIGEDGMVGLSAQARAVVEGAEVILGAERHHTLSPNARATRLAWPHPFDALIGTLLAHRGQRIVVLATGDPLWFSVGARIAQAIPAEQIRYHPQLSAFQWAACRLGWSLADTETLTAHGRPAAQVVPWFWPGARLLILTAGSHSPGEIAALLVARGYGASRLTVLANLGGPGEARLEGTAADWAAPPGTPGAVEGGAPALGARWAPVRPDPGADPSAPQQAGPGADRPAPPSGAADPAAPPPGAAPAAVPPFPPFHTLAVECRGGPSPLLARVPGLPDAAFAHDGVMTKREVRAITLARLMPARGAVLWDIGVGCGSIAIEWMRAAPEALAIGIDPNAARLALAAANAAALGTPKLRLVQAWAPEALAGLPRPDAVFIGGGLSGAVVAAARAALAPRGRLVANAVTVRAEARLAALHARLGGDLTRIGIARAAPVGGLTGWRPAMPVTQWVLET